MYQFGSEPVSLLSLIVGSGFEANQLELVKRKFDNYSLVMIQALKGLKKINNKKM